MFPNWLTSTVWIHSLHGWPRSKVSIIEVIIRSQLWYWTRPKKIIIMGVLGWVFVFGIVKINNYSTLWIHHCIFIVNNIPIIGKSSTRNLSVLNLFKILQLIIVLLELFIVPVYCFVVKYHDTLCTNLITTK